MSLRNLEGLQPKGAQGHSKSSISQVFTSQIDPALTWEFIAWVRSVSKLPIFVKVSHSSRPLLPAVKVDLPSQRKHSIVVL